MDRDEIIQRLRKVFVAVLKHENFEMKNELSAANVSGWDSLTHMVIISDIEAAFGIKFKLKELNKLSNLGNLIELVTLKTGQ